MFRNWMIWILAAGWMLASCAPTSQPTSSASDSPQPDSPPQTLTSPSSDSAPTLLPEEPPPARAESEFRTDFSKHSVPYSEILSGGPPKDGIPSIDAPKFQSTREADEWLSDREPVVFVQVGDDARAYPIQRNRYQAQLGVVLTPADFPTHLYMVTLVNGSPKMPSWIAQDRRRMLLAASR